MTEQELLKANALLLADHHKKHCNDPGCGVSLTMIGVLLHKAGIKLTKEEFQRLG